MRFWFGNVSGGRKKSNYFPFREYVSNAESHCHSCISYGKFPLTPPFQV